MASAGGIDLEAIKPARLLDGNPLVGAVRPVDDDVGAAALLAGAEPWRADLQPAGGPEDAQAVVLRQRHAARHLGEDVAGKLQQRRRPFVDAGPAEMRRAEDLFRIDEGLAHRRAGDEPRHRHRVAADVEDAAAGGVVGEQAMLRIGIGHAESEARLDQPDLADGTRSDQLDDAGGQRVEAVHESFAEEGAGLPRGVDHGVGFVGRNGERLLAEHVLAGFRRTDRPFGMCRVRRRDIDRLDLGVVEHGLIAVEDPAPGKLSPSPCLFGSREAMAVSRPVAEWGAPRQKPWRSCRGR